LLNFTSHYRANTQNEFQFSLTVNEAPVGRQLWTVVTLLTQLINQQAYIFEIRRGIYFNRPQHRSALFKRFLIIMMLLIIAHSNATYVDVHGLEGGLTVEIIEE
jgi:hypothetical protein